MTPPLFKEGDVVRLVSGGPAMTVTCRSRGGMEILFYDCMWFTNRQISMGNFPETTIKRVGWFRRVAWGCQ